MSSPFEGMYDGPAFDARQPPCPTAASARMQERLKLKRIEALIRKRRLQLEKKGRLPTAEACNDEHASATTRTLCARSDAELDPLYAERDEALDELALLDAQVQQACPQGMVP